MIVFSTTMSARKPSGMTLPLYQWNHHTFINDRHGDLRLKADSGMAQFEGHTLGIHRFQETWTNGTMDLDGKSDDLFRKSSLLEHEELRAAPWFSVFSVVRISKE